MTKRRTTSYNNQGLNECSLRSCVLSSFFNLSFIGILPQSKAILLMKNMLLWFLEGR